MAPHTVCLLNDSFPPLIDGVSNAVLNYAQNIEARRGRAIVVTPRVPGADDSRYPFPVLRYPSIDTRDLMGYVTGIPFSPEIVLRLQRKKTELLHLHCPMTSAILARQLRDTLDLPLILTWHTKYDIDIANAIHGRLLQEEAVRALIQNVSACDEVWTVSRGAGENLRSLGFEGEYVVMQNGVDLPRGRPPQAQIAAATGDCGLPAGVPIFLFVGRLMWYKGLRIILDALASLADEGIAFCMVFIGAGGDEAAVRAYAEARSLAPRCRFLGAVRDREALRAWYSRADLFLFPSTFDTNGLVVREAAACSTASVLIAGSCAAEGVTDGRNGFLIEENAASLAQALRTLCASPGRMADVGRAACRELYLSWGDAVDRAADRYEVVLDRFRSGRYPRMHTPAEEFLRAQGRLIESIEELQARRRRLLDDLRADRLGVQERLAAERETLRERLYAEGDELRDIMSAVREFMLTGKRNGPPDDPGQP